MKLLFFLSGIITLILISYYFKARGKLWRDVDDVSTGRYIWFTARTVLFVMLVLAVIFGVLFGLVKLIDALGW